ncbi:PaaI family thioesterase [Thalassobius sp. Cn5-15]|uniref:PaaI family thioesterase n=1 Tax=Thalassobius sp. Cn5-15 TaxID=2917763 RepID=UPI001EF2E49C|nr:PaaI family thioesterase [Thalassobius sp. Cn5-15]MCG7494297.1 PaaI family thioesterase [Thalassobius sp. Cn5-15]
MSVVHAPWFAKTPADLLTGEELLAVSGLEAMQKVLRGEVAGAPIGQLMGFILSEVEDGRVSFDGVPDFQVANPMGTVHGGWYGTVLDSCMACAVMTKVPQGSVYTTMEYKINIIRAIPLGTKVRATGVVQHAGRSSGVANGEIRGVEDDRLYATGSTTCIILKMK